MVVRYSIIIPTFNRIQQLLLTLVAFETQTYPKHLMEVIVADDGSTDGTQQMVLEFQASYRLIYVAQPEQRGRSAVRNLGLRHAKGRYVIFCDADFLVLPHFLSTVDRYHRKYPNAILSGTPHSMDDAYTHYHPDFSPEEQLQFHSTIGPTGVWKPEFENAIEVMPLITPDDLIHQTGTLSRVLIPRRIPPAIIDQFARTDVAPWMLFVTRCVAVRRRYLLRLKGFNERFVLYGLEDWELGYRLHRLKLPFIPIKEVVGYHQEHPTSFRGNQVNLENLRIMFDCHGFNDSAVNLFVLSPPSEDLEKYKNTLRILRRGLRMKSTRSSALLLRRTLRLAAKQFYRQHNVQVYKQSIRRSQQLSLNRRSQVATVLREMLEKADKLVD
ncbi:glycosyltransferase family 2 protein [Paenibacillus solisilvae]|uniref:Glycosyltransferase family 2 protein n=1 Tax=Paenibacillus solisilvae TaxID=2486751 RepID=A0ABW0W9I0_9BACL